MTQFRVGDRVAVLDEGLAMLRRLCPGMPPNHLGTVEELLEGERAMIRFDGGDEQVAPYPFTMLEMLGKPSEPASPAPERDQTTDSQSETAQVHNPANPANEGGNVPATAAASEPAGESPATRVVGRFMREGRWIDNISRLRDTMYKQNKKRFTSKESCLDWVYGELDRMYPPLENSLAHSRKAQIAPLHQSVQVNDGSIQGLGAIPETWPELPANASLASEIGWVQANRLRIVTEQPGRATVVDLGKALSPAPSWAALGWLETSIRSYAKYVDVAAKATSSDDGDASVMKRERMAIDEVRALLAEMEEQG